MAESAQAERPDILANAVVSGPNVLPLDPSASPAVPQEPEADTTADDTAAPTGEAPPPSNDDEESEGEATEDEEAEPEEEVLPPQAKKKKPTIQDRLGTLAQQRKLAQQEAEYWKQRALQVGSDQLAEAQRQQREQQSGIPRQANGAPIPPVETEFPTHQDYLAAQQLYQEANIEWHVSRALAQERLRQEEANALRMVRELYSDYDEVVRNTGVRLNNDVSAAVLASDRKHQLIYRLATHPDEAMALENVNGTAAYLAIGRLESLVATESQRPEPAPAPEVPVTPPVSHAPPPIQPTRGNGAAPVRDYDQMSLQEFFEARNREESRRRR